MLLRLSALITTLFLLNVSIVQFVSPCETHEGEAGAGAHSHNGHNEKDTAPQSSTPELPACCLALTSCAVTLTTCATAARGGSDLDNTRVLVPSAERENSWVTQVEPPPPKT